MNRPPAERLAIDCHCHLFPKEVAQKALPQLSACSGVTPLTDGTAEDTLQKMPGWPLARMLFLPVATQPHQQRRINDFAASVQGGPLLCCGTVHPQAPDALSELERLCMLGLKGVKLHPEYQQTFIDSPACIQVIRRAAELKLPIFFHAGADPAYAPPWRSAPARVARLLDMLADLPDLRLVAAHLGGYLLWDEVERHLLGRNIYFDTSFVAGRVPPAQARRIIMAQEPQYILFGSDCPWQSPRAAYDWLLDLGLPDSWLPDILYGNAARLLNLA